MPGLAPAGSRIDLTGGQADTVGDAMADLLAA
jgi:hypothetical protein